MPQSRPAHIVTHGQTTRLGEFRSFGIFVFRNSGFKAQDASCVLFILFLVLILVNLFELIFILHFFLYYNRWNILSKKVQHGGSLRLPEYAYVVLASEASLCDIGTSCNTIHHKIVQSAVFERFIIASRSLGFYGFFLCQKLWRGPCRGWICQSGIYLCSILVASIVYNLIAWYGCGRIGKLMAIYFGILFIVTVLSSSSSLSPVKNGNGCLLTGEEAIKSSPSSATTGFPPDVGEADKSGK